MTMEQIRFGGRAVDPFGLGLAPTPVGLAADWVSADSVTAMDTQVDADVESLNAAIAACSGFPADLKTSWDGDYSAWKTIHNSWQKGVIGWAPLWPGVNHALLAFFTNTYSDMVAFSKSKVEYWKGIVADKCPNYHRTPAPVIPSVNPAPPSPGVNVGDILKWGTVLVVAIGGIYVVTHVVK